MISMKIRTMFVLTILISLLVGCSSRDSEPITDQFNSPLVKTVTMNDKMISYRYMADTMDRGNHDYYNKSVVVERDYYEYNELKRGDVVWYKSNMFTSDHNVIGRVIGLPGEKVEIEKGQIYINGSRLDTFYGSFNRAGLNLKEYIQVNIDRRRQEIKDVKKFRKETERANDMKEITVPEEHVFLVGDDWFRSEKVTVKSTEIEGKIHGYAKSSMNGDTNE